MAKLNYKKLNINTGKLKPIRSVALDLAKAKVEDSKNQFLNSFLSHPVTLEIQSGPGSNNISGTLGGYGDLFSFIGFPSGFDPIQPIKNLISKIRLIAKSYAKAEKNSVLISFDVDVPSLSSFENQTPIPWASGRSWLTGIERGISGFGYFISREGSGRSSAGQQADKKIRNVFFRNVSYFSAIYSKFLKNLKSSK